jgi:hypothetical protein
MLALGHEVVAMIVDHIESLRNKPVVHKKDRSSLEICLREPLPEQGVDISAVIRQVRRDILGNVTHNDHPRDFAFVSGPSNFVSAMADALASGFNVISTDWMDASDPSEVELVTIDWLRQICGLPEGAGGLFASGGSMATGFETVCPSPWEDFSPGHGVPRLLTRPPYRAAPRVRLPLKCLRGPPLPNRGSQRLSTRAQTCRHLPACL